LNDFTLVRRFDIGLSDGARLIPVENAEADHIAVSRSWLRKHNLAADLCVLVKVSGDSMSPTIPVGSLVLVDISDMRSTREGIYAFRQGGEAFIKRLVPVGVTEDDKSAALVIVSDNPSIAPETISGEGLADIRIVGRVRCVIANL
jgi:phage repressor protein C with HTH and peptisase S24 domain